MVAVYSGSGGSDGGSSSKKVSFNKAVRVKKYTTPPHQRSVSPIVYDQPKFWFKVCRPSPSQFSPSSSNSSSNNNFYSYHTNFDQSTPHPHLHPHPQPQTQQPVEQQLSPVTNISQHPTPVIRSYSDSESCNTKHRSSPSPPLTLSQQQLPSTSSSSVPPPIHPFSKNKNIIQHNSDSDSTNTSSSSSSCGGGKSEPVRPPRRRKPRPLSTIIDVDSSSLDANDSVLVSGENMPRSELSTSSNVRSRNKVDRSDSRRIINYEPYRSPPKDSTILITPETDGYTHEWIPRAASPSMLGKSALISDEENDTNNNKIKSSSLGNGHAMEKSVRHTSPTLGSEKLGYKSPSPMDYDMEDTRMGDKKNDNNSSMMVVPKVDDNEIIIRKETKKPTKFKVMWGAKVKKLPMFPPPPPPSLMKSKEDKSASKTSSKVINYENDPTYMEDTIEDRDRPCMDEKKAQKKIIENYQASSPEMKARRLESTDRTRSTSPTRSPIRSETFVVSRNDSSKDGMSKSLIEKSGDRGVERYDDTVLVEKFSPTTIERTRDIRSDVPLSNRMEPVATWKSGPMLISDQRDKQSSSNYVPGEGRTETSLEVGSRVWRNKTRRMYEEPIIGKHRAGYQPDRDLSPVGRRSSPPPPPLPPSSMPSSGSRLEKPSEEMMRYEKEKEKENDNRKNQHQREHHHHHRPRTDDDKLMITGDELDELFLQKEEAPKLGNEPDFFPFLDSYNNPPMEDKACQCNLKKSSKSLRNRSPPAANITDDEHGSVLTNTGYRVIKSGKDGSVSAYSNVPSLDDHEDNRERRAVFDDNQRIVFHHPERSDVIYSQVDKSKKRNPNETQGSRYVQRDAQNLAEDYDDYVYEANPVRDLRSEQGSRGPVKRRSSPSPVSTSRYSEGLRPPSRSSSISPNKTITSTTKNYGFSMKTAADSPVVKLPSKPIGGFDEMSNGTLTKKGRREGNKRQTIEETMSISDVSSDVTRPSANRHRQHRQHHHQHHHQTVNATDSEDMAPPKSNFKELNHHHQRRNEMSYEDGSPTHRRIVGRKAIPYDGQSINSNTSWYKSLDEDYRKSANEPTINRAKDSYTLSRVNDRRDLKRDYSPMSARNAYTLDRRYMDQRKRNKRPYLTNDGTSGDSQLGIRSDLDIGHERVIPNSMKKYSSNRDLHSDLDVSPARGGLAAAYRARQKRASSLNRYAESDLMYPASRVHHVPVYHGSQSQLNRLHPAHSAMPDNLERMSRSYQGGSRTRLYQNEPISLYIPAVKESSRDQSGKRTSDDERGSKIGIGRTQSILSLSRGSKLGIMKKPSTKGNSNTSLNEITSKLNGYLNTGPSGLHDEDEIVALREGDENVKSKKKSLKRSQSIPKDAKLPWFQKLKMKVKS